MHDADSAAKPTRQPRWLSSLSAGLQAEIAQAAERIRNSHGSEVADSRIADRAGKLFRRTINPPRPVGSQIRKTTATALQMRMQGKTWPEIYPVIWPAFPTWDKYKRQYRTHNLQRYVRRAAETRGYIIPRPFRPVPKSKNNPVLSAKPSVSPKSKQ
jgi:hypothetical protein